MSIPSIDGHGRAARPAVAADRGARPAPELVASVGTIAKGARHALEVALRHDNETTALDLRVHAVHGDRRVPTSRGFRLALRDLRALRRLLGEAERIAVSMGLLTGGGADA